MATITIDGIAMPEPNKFEWGEQDLDSEKTTRNAAGNMTRDVIAKKSKISLGWPSLDMDEISKILKAIDKPFFTITAPNPKAGGIVTKTFYAGDRTAPAYSFNSKFAKMMWSGLSFDVIEK